MIDLIDGDRLIDLNIVSALLCDCMIAPIDLRDNQIITAYLRRLYPLPVIAVL